MKLTLLHEKKKCTWDFDKESYSDDEEKAYADLVAFAGSKFSLKDVQVFMLASETDLDNKKEIPDGDELLNELDEITSMAYFLINGTPVAPSSYGKYTVSVNLSKCGCNNNLSTNVSMCDFSDEEGWNDLWQDLCGEIGDELKNDKWEDENTLVDITGDVSIEKLSQFIDIFKNVSDIKTQTVEFSVEVEWQVVCTLNVRFTHSFLFFAMFVSFLFVSKGKKRSACNTFRQVIYIFK